MITIVYKIDPADRESERDWLREQKVYPTFTDRWDWNTGKAYTWVGVIVSPDAALSIKLRHKLDLQKEYRQR